MTAPRTVPPALPGVDYIIPLSNSGNADFHDRVDNLNLALNGFLARQSGVDLTVYLVEQVIDEALPLMSAQARIPAGLKVVVKTLRAPVFCKPWLYNVGVRISHGEHLILADVDNYADQDYFAGLVAFADQRNLQWCMAWDTLLFLTRDEKTALMACGEFIPAKGRKYGYPGPIGSPGNAGAALFFRRAFLCNEVLGVNELFRKWGYEDSELLFRSFKASGTYEKYPVCTMHLWHAPSADNTWRPAVPNVAQDKSFNQVLFEYIVSGNNYLTINEVLRGMRMGSDEAPADLHATLARHGIALGTAALLN